MENVSMMDVRITGASHKALYGAIGLVAGGAVGAVFGGTQETSCNVPPNERIPCEVVGGMFDSVVPIATGLLGGIAGTVAGVLVGARKGSTWQPVIR